LGPVVPVGSIGGIGLALLTGMSAAKIGACEENTVLKHATAIAATIWDRFTLSLLVEV
jgi:hypothetical protein